MGGLGGVPPVVGMPVEIVIPSGVCGRGSRPICGGGRASCVVGALVCHAGVVPVPGVMVGAAFSMSAGGAGGVKRACWVPSVVVLGRLVISARV